MNVREPSPLHCLRNSSRWLWLAATLLAVVAAAPLAMNSVRAQTGALAITAGPTAAEALITETSAVISWTTNLNGSTVVEFGPSPALGQVYRAIEPMTDYEPLVQSHSMTLWELKPDTLYYYKVRSVSENGASSAESQVQTFRTKTPAAQPVVEPAQTAAPAPTTTEPAPAQPAPTTQPAPAPAPVPASTQPAPDIKPLPAVEPVETTPAPKPTTGQVQPPQPTETSVAPASEPGVPAPTGSGEAVPTAMPGEQPSAQPTETPPVPAPTSTLTDRMMGSLNDFQAGLTGGGGGGAVAVQLGIVAAGVAEPAGICEQNGIKAERCAAWLETRYADKTCAENGRLTKEACEKFLTDGNNGVFPGCEGKTAEECASIKAMTTIGYLPHEAKQTVDATINEMVASGAAVDLPGFSAVGPDQAAGAAWWPSAPAAGGETSPAVVVIDSDHDGLPDDIERSLGTDPDKADTDGDGVSDAEELKKGTDPLGEGAMERKVAPVEAAIIGGLPLEQPLGAGEVDDGYGVVLGAPAGTGVPTVINFNAGTVFPMDPNANIPEEEAGQEQTGGKDVVLSGRCAPDTTCLLYIYSYVPLVLATVTDTDGNWSYDLSGGSLADGQHMVYVANIDAAGKIVKKSNPLSLFIKEAQAVTVGDFMRADQNVPTEPAARFQKYYIIGVILLIAAAGVAFLVLQKRLGRSRNGGVE